MRSPIAVTVVVLLVGATSARAQTSPAPAGQAPLVLERIHNPFVVAPDYKVTDLDGQLGQLAGAYAGRLLADQVLVGGAAYWLADGHDGTRLTYGGVLVGWSSSPQRWLRFGARGLVGVGTARLETNFAGPLVPGAPPQTFARFGSRGVPGVQNAPRTIRVLVQDDFFVFEPQANLLTSVTDHIALDWCAGYRVVGFTDALEERLDGATGSVALQLRW